MRNASAVVIACLLAAALGALAVWHFTHRSPELPDPPALVLKVREVARLETLDVSLYKKLDFSPDPRPTGSTWGDVAQWATYSLRPPRGRAIIFADAHLSIDLRNLVQDRVARVELDLLRVEIPDEDDASSAPHAAERALPRGRAGELEGEVAATALGEATDLVIEARASAEQTLRSLFVGLGFTEVEFVKELPAPVRG